MNLQLAYSDFNQDLPFSPNIWSLREILPSSDLPHCSENRAIHESLRLINDARVLSQCMIPLDIQEEGGVVGYSHQEIASGWNFEEEILKYGTSMDTPSSLSSIIENKECEFVKITKTNPEIPFKIVKEKRKSKRIKRGRKPSKKNNAKQSRLSIKNQKARYCIQENQSHELSSGEEYHANISGY